MTGKPELNWWVASPLLLLVVAAGACGSRQRADPGARSSPAELTISEPETVAAPDEDDDAPLPTRTRHDSAADPAVGPEPIGVRECDEFLTKYARCVAQLSPGQSASANDAIRSLRESLRQMLAIGSPTELARSCAQMSDVVEQAMVAAGCTW